MARQPRAAAQETGAQEQDAKETNAPRFVLAKNHGMIIDGRSHFFPGGTEFDPASDGALISALHRTGATFE